jgi:hypothetical protein
LWFDAGRIDADQLNWVNFNLITKINQLILIRHLGRVAEIQMLWMASAEHILVLWIQAIPAGKTSLPKHLSKSGILMRI